MARDKHSENIGGGMPRLIERIHSEPVRVGTDANTPFNESVMDVLHPRKFIEGSPFAKHMMQLRERLYGAHSGKDAPPSWSYEPQYFRRVMRDDPHALGAAFEGRTRECSEILENGCALLEHINKLRTTGTSSDSSSETGPVWPVVVTGEDGLVREILTQARGGANQGRSTKSPEVSGCANPSWLQVMDEHGLRGAAAYPIFNSGAWLGGLSGGEFGDWRQDYLCTLIYGFYLEYNLDTVGGSNHNHYVRDLCCLWEMPDLPAELRTRRAHLLGEMAYIDGKRRMEAELRAIPTTGLTAWVFGDRDRWRDFKACDSGMFGHYLSCVPGDSGRDDLMLTGLTQDWADLGPDLRNGECAQSVLTLTRGSISTASLIEAYERSVWMVNAELTPEGGVKPERFSLMFVIMDVCVWNMCNHRHDLWRYFALASDACGQVQRRDLYKSGQLADCYSKEFEPTEPAGSSRVTVPRRPLHYTVTVAGRKHSGSIDIHTAVVDAVESGSFPMELVEYEYLIPRLLCMKSITSSEFLAHMDAFYCEHHAILMRAAHKSNFSMEFSTALILFTMEQWWFGFPYAVGLGSLIEAQPGTVANDRVHPDR
ncbi:hypothetical protein [Myxococcus eversor]|uniref:hypothetical protein n=1 Tax=Myxococcus eversor TaxID=2709661 RepID=UPI0013D83228|nr:hypothetical protein [Myxococcus eversor]